MLKLIHFVLSQKTTLYQVEKKYECCFKQQHTKANKITI